MTKHERTDVTFHLKPDSGPPPATPNADPDKTMVFTPVGSFSGSITIDGETRSFHATGVVSADSFGGARLRLDVDEGLVIRGDTLQWASVAPPLDATRGSVSTASLVFAPRDGESRRSVDFKTSCRW